MVADERQRDEDAPDGLRKRDPGGREAQRRAEEKAGRDEGHERPREGAERRGRDHAVVRVVERPQQVHDPPRSDRHEEGPERHPPAELARMAHEHHREDGRHHRRRPPRTSRSGLPRRTRPGDSGRELPGPSAFPSLPFDSFRSVAGDGDDDSSALSRRGAVPFVLELPSETGLDHVNHERQQKAGCGTGPEQGGQPARVLRHDDEVERDQRSPSKGQTASRGRRSRRGALPI